jgi:integrase
MASFFHLFASPCCRTSPGVNHTPAYPMLTAKGCAYPMPTVKLSAAFWRTAKAEPGAERTVYWDKGMPSFGLMVTKAAHRSGVVQYRADGVSRRHTIRHALGLEGARREARVILGQVARGRDPVLDRRKTAKSSKSTLRAVCENFLIREGGRTADKRQANLERLVYPALGNWQIEAVKRSDINQLLDTIEDERGAPMADQMLALLRRVCNWHAIRDDTFRTPFVPGMARSRPDQRERSRTLTDDELKRVWATAVGFPAPWGQLIRFLLLTASRRSEASGMTWNELKGDLWTIPATRYKTATEVMLPLSGAAMAVLAEIPRIKDCKFPFTTDGRRPVSGFSVFKLRFDMACGVKDWRLHDLRRSSRSLLSRAGVNSDIAERCLGHAIPGVRRVYDRHHYLPEMRQAFEALAAQIDIVLKRNY